MEKAVVLPPSEQKTSLSRYLRWSWRTLISRQELVIFVLLLLVGAALSLRTDTFFTTTNLLNVARQFSWFAIAAFGVSMVIIVGGIDLSVGAVMALAGFVSALAMQAGLPVPLAVVMGLLSGGLVGLINGTLVGRVGLPPFMVTLGTMGIARGITLGLTGGEPLRDLPSSFNVLGQEAFALGPIAVPLPVIWMLGLAMLVSLLLNQTVLGRYIYTVGSGERALIAAGVPAAQIKVVVYTLSGLLAAIGGMVMTARLGVAAPTAATGYELDIIAAAVIGGASLFGGEGSVIGVVLGAALMQTVRNGLVQLGAQAHWQVGAIGVMTLIVILLDYGRRRRV